MKQMVRCILFHLLVASALGACNQLPDSIRVSENLLSSLSPDEATYLPLLSKAAKGDSIALVNFIKINSIEDATGYEHGFVIFQLMKEVGDVRFSKALSKLDASELRNISNYLEVGLDNDQANTALYEKNFRLSRNLLEGR